MSSLETDKTNLPYKTGQFQICSLTGWKHDKKARYLQIKEINIESRYFKTYFQHIFKLCLTDNDGRNYVWLQENQQ